MSMIALQRDCPAVLIPDGTEITIPVGTLVSITQSLGNSYTVNMNGRLARINGEDADALDLKVEDQSEIVDDGPLTKEKILERLRSVFDPEIPINIVDLGLVYECEISDREEGGKRVDITMTLTAAGCGMGPFLVEDVNYLLKTTPHVAEYNVELVFDPPWDQSMMTEAARLESGMMW